VVPEVVVPGVSVGGFTALAADVKTQQQNIATTRGAKDERQIASKPSSILYTFLRHSLVLTESIASLKVGYLRIRGNSSTI